MPTYNTGEEMRAFVARQMRGDHHRFEQMARRVRDPGRVGCWTGEGEERLTDEIVVNVYSPSNPAKPPVLAFGNTRMPDSVTDGRQLLEFYSDLVADIDQLEVGAYRFAINDGRIKTLIDELTARHGRKVVLTGHSLGGALAQIAACNYWTQVHSVVTFQSPKIGRSYRKLHGRPVDAGDAASRSFHYRLEQDELVTGAGERLSPGRTVQFRWSDSRTLAWADDVAAVLQQLSNAIPEIGPAVAEAIGAVREIARRIAWIVKMYLAHTTTFFEPFLRLRDPAQEIDPQDLSADYERIVDDAANRNVRDRDTLIEWLRRYGPDVLLVAGAAGSGGALNTPVVFAARARIRRVLYVLIWDHLKHVIDQAIASGGRVYPGWADLRFPLSHVDRRLPPLVPAWNFIASEQHEAMRQNLAWRYPGHFGGGPILPGPAVQTEPDPPRDALLREEDGLLTDAGWRYVQTAGDVDRGNRGREQIDALLRGYYQGDEADESTGQGARGSYWLELLTTREAIQQLRAEPLDPAEPNILHARSPHGDVLVLVGQKIGSMLEFAASTGARRFFPGLTDESLAVIRDLRTWSVMRLLVDRIRLERTRDQELERAYFACHEKHLDCRRADPLRLLPGARQESLCCSVAPEDFTLEQFFFFACRHRVLTSMDREGRARDALARGGRRSNEARAVTGAEQTLMPFNWYNFLFRSAPPEDRRDRTPPPRAGVGFVADEWWAVQSCVDSRGRCELAPDPDRARAGQARTGVKALRNKKPDVVQIFSAQRRIEVLDPSFRWHEAWHNFKTQFYCAVLRAALPGWGVGGLDYRTARRNRAV